MELVSTVQIFHELYVCVQEQFAHDFPFQLLRNKIYIFGGGKEIYVVRTPPS